MLTNTCTYVCTKRCTRVLTYVLTDMYIPIHTCLQRVGHISLMCTHRLHIPVHHANWQPHISVLINFGQHNFLWAKAHFSVAAADLSMRGHVTLAVMGSAALPTPRVFPSRLYYSPEVGGDTASSGRSLVILSTATVTVSQGEVGWSPSTGH